MSITNIILSILVLCCLCCMFSVAYLQGYLFGSPKLYRIIKKHIEDEMKFYEETGDTSENWKNFICGDSDAKRFLIDRKYKTWRDTSEGRLVHKLQGDLPQVNIPSCSEL